MLRIYMFLPNLIKICVLYTKILNSEGFSAFEKLKIHVIFDWVDKLKIGLLNLRVQNERGRYLKSKVKLIEIYCDINPEISR